MPDTCRVFQLKVETSCIAQFRDGRRGEGKDSRLLDAGEISHGATGNGTDLLRRFRPQAPVLQLDEHHRRILATTGKVEASYRENGFDIVFFLFAEIAGDLVDNNLDRKSTRLNSSH